MSVTNAPFGMRPAFFPTGLERAQSLKNGIASGYGSNILKGQPVKMTTDGKIQPVTGTEAFVGSFHGVSWTDSDGRRRVSNKWTAGTIGTEIVAEFYNDPLIVYEIQADGSVPQTAVFDNANFSSVSAGSMTTGLSQCTMSTTLTGATTSGQLRIVDIAPNIDNDWSDPFTVVRVQIAKHQAVAPINAI